MQGGRKAGFTVGGRRLCIGSEPWDVDHTLIVSRDGVWEEPKWFPCDRIDLHRLVAGIVKVIEAEIGVIQRRQPGGEVHDELKVKAVERSDKEPRV